MSTYVYNPLEMSDKSREEFCIEYNISQDDWNNADIDWKTLVEISIDHSERFSSLSASASMYAGIIQGIEGVHSVRWRVKDPSHLIAKIIRKRSTGSDAYKNLSLNNYYDIITDLVGIRALHLFKEEFAPIHKALVPLMVDKEPPVANIRSGDSEKYRDLYGSFEINTIEHNAGYRSVHYVKTVKPLNRDLHIEIQVRTVFEEGWSEVDHRVRYPSFSDDPLVVYASAILNRLSGMADEMSTYALELVRSLKDKSNLIDMYRRESDESIKRIEELLIQLEGARQDNVGNEQLIKKLKSEMDSLKRGSEIERQILNELSKNNHLNSRNALSNISDIMDNSLKSTKIGNEFDKNSAIRKERGISGVYNKAKNTSQDD